jgi:NTP pyrophosphatase (non-canonical NTP hydrolase)
MFLFKTDNLQSKEGSIMFENAWDALAEIVFKNAVDKGFWDNGRNDGEAIALIHSELSEALEALRSNDAPDRHLPHFKGVEVELADAVIRIMDYSKGKGYRVGAAIMAKIEYNQTRERLHGRQF